MAKLVTILVHAIGSAVRYIVYVFFLFIACGSPDPSFGLSEGDYRNKIPKGITLPTLAWCPNKPPVLKITKKYVNICGLEYVKQAVEYLTDFGQPTSIEIIDELPCDSIYENCNEYDTIFIGVELNKVPEGYIGYARTTYSTITKRYYTAEIHVLHCEYNLLLHELGHSIGMHHADVENHAMNPTVTSSGMSDTPGFTEQERLAMERNKSEMLMRGYCD